MTIAASYPKSGRVGVPLGIPVRLTSGRATRVDVWLDDGSFVGTATAPQGVEFQELNVFVTPMQLGAWRVNARAVDACGNANQTGVARTVVVQ